jgi:hypothetical protein
MRTVLPLLLTWSAAALAAVPQELSVQGVLRNGSGQLQSTSTPITVRIFDGQASMNQLGSTIGPTTTPVQNGLFTYVLPLQNSDLTALVAAPEAWMEITAGADVFPRTKIEPEMYAQVARIAAVADGLSSNCVGCVTDTMLAGGISAAKIMGNINSGQLQGTAIAAAMPTTQGQTLVFNQAQNRWEPGLITLAGDATGPQNATKVTGLAGSPVDSMQPMANSLLRFTNGAWHPTLDLWYTTNNTLSTAGNVVVGTNNLLAVPTWPTLSVEGLIRASLPYSIVVSQSTVTTTTRNAWVSPAGFTVGIGNQPGVYLVQASARAFCLQAGADTFWKARLFSITNNSAVGAQSFGMGTATGYSVCQGDTTVPLTTTVPLVPGEVLTVQFWIQGTGTNPVSLLGDANGSSSIVLFRLAN